MLHTTPYVILEFIDILKWINLGDINPEVWSACIFLVFHFDISNSSDCSILEGQVILRLRFTVDIFYDDVECFPRITLFKIDIPNEVNVAKVLRRLERMREDVSRLVGEIRLGGCEGYQA